MSEILDSSILHSSSFRWAEKHSHDHLLAGKQWVADELARAQGDLALRHLVGWLSKFRRKLEEKRMLNCEPPAKFARRTDVCGFVLAKTWRVCRAESDHEISWQP